jgi:hypothetical protein
MAFTLRRFIETEEDYDVFDGETRVGRVYQREGLNGEGWRWQLAKKIADPALAGKSRTKAEALAAVDEAYRKPL